MNRQALLLVGLVGCAFIFKTSVLEKLTNLIVLCSILLIAFASYKPNWRICGTNGLQVILILKYLICWIVYFTKIPANHLRQCKLTGIILGDSIF